MRQVRLKHFTSQAIHHHLLERAKIQATQMALTALYQGRTPTAEDIRYFPKRTHPRRNRLLLLPIDKPMVRFLRLTALLDISRGADRN